MNFIRVVRLKLDEMLPRSLLPSSFVLNCCALVFSILAPSVTPATNALWPVDPDLAYLQDKPSLLWYPDNADSLEGGGSEESDWPSATDEESSLEWLANQGFVSPSSESTDEEEISKRSRLRFGKRDRLRFGKRDRRLRFGKRSEYGILRQFSGKREPDRRLRFGKRDNDRRLRFGKRDTDRRLRFGKRDTDRRLRFGKRSETVEDFTIDNPDTLKFESKRSDTQRQPRSGSDLRLRFGKRDPGEPSQMESEPDAGKP
ncbi:unnamed protein product [Cyprideis torosa]|uniref:Uncharacterized protein n=1 Tax=Cyprideis torosa TaxID=163714 RepID=A0A7R8ZQI5_9CRUS|nr:unnamed protein product [Cyprideis torosa]CAG0896466.1 unnamed protein product [Cyprideis torosa]